MTRTFSDCIMIYNLLALFEKWYQSSLRQQTLLPQAYRAKYLSEQGFSTWGACTPKGYIYLYEGVYLRIVIEEKTIICM